ncbi:MAG: ABC transporter ATP-binding protein [Leptolyngbyaceae cyanobacterium MO_188.B28]|nr:ABC transporter ATP-binding protein [Leptolyngbyaceae cyanobacterium MO_188.B28]
MILESHKLKKSYRDKGRLISAVHDVSLRIAAGEVAAFLGPNGAGKTTTIKIIAGLLRPDEGWVRICDRNPHKNQSALKLLGAVLEGNRNLYWRLTPAENLEYFGVLRGLSPRIVQQRSHVLLERFNLAHKAQTIVGALSRGMQQKVAIMVALIHQPRLLLLDEPTLGLDVEATEEVKQLVREIASQGCAILLTTHQLAIAEELADRIAIINQGKVIMEQATHDLIRQFSGSAYQIELEVSLDPARRLKLENLGTDIETETKLRVSNLAALYQVLALLKPLPVLRIQKEEANLTDIFLKLVREQ